MGRDAALRVGRPRPTLPGRLDPPAALGLGVAGGGRLGAPHVVGDVGAAGGRSARATSARHVAVAVVVVVVVAQVGLVEGLDVVVG